MLFAILCALYFLILALLLLPALHRGSLVALAWRHRRRLAPPPAPPLAPGSEPMVTVQLPLYNEADVVERLLEHVARLDWPRRRFEIQVLDDSTDDTSERVQLRVASLRQRGIAIEHLRRSQRRGFKAGALDFGLRRARGELIAIFDADFVPGPSFLRDIVPHFADTQVGCVQARWGHLNRDASLLTRVQALMLDGHHLVENRVRAATGRFFNFSGTAGVWRRAAIESAGGWQHDTLTEDLDLSYRAQLAGWRLVYRADTVAPAELPEQMEALRAQQFRWAKGTVQTARKLLARLWRAPVPLALRIEAFFHLTPHFAYPLLVALAALMLPLLLTAPDADPLWRLLMDAPLVLGSTGSLAAFYVLAERAQGRPARRALALLPAAIALGAGLAPHLARAVWQGLRGPIGEFVRTPKSGGAPPAGRYRLRTALPLVELALALESAATALVALGRGHFVAVPFALLFACGLGGVAFASLRERYGHASQRVLVIRRLREASTAGVAKSPTRAG